MNLRPIENNIIILPLDKPDGVILIPEQAKEKPGRGEVMAVGPGMIDESGALISPYVSVGDIVYYPKYGGIKLNHEKAEYKVIRDHELVAVEIKNV